jgi:hypothetical protein
VIESAGFADVEIEGPFDPFEGASGEGNARAFETYGWTFRAVKVQDVRRPETPMVCSRD